MRIKTITSFGICLALCVCTYAQSPVAKELPAKRTTKPVKIDGLINEEAWKDAAEMTNLTEFRPKVGAVEPPETKTIAYLMYDDEGIYFGGYCYERTKDSIATELTGRDGFGTNDYIGLIFDTYNDKINGFEYFVTPLGEQWDAKMSPGGNDNGGEDFSWNAVWSSKAVIHNDGWSFEMHIPFSAIRFSKETVQTWGFNITRRRRKTEQQYTWNPIDPNVNGFLTQEATWTGITNIKPPLRLQFSPYFSNVTSHFPNNDPAIKDWNNTVNGGMDVKYGINQAFTLDVTLIPDFGQVQSDNRVLNLSPYEVRFTENRPFFTEGTELFSKGDLFYSRRIGKDAAYTHRLSEYLSAEDSLILAPNESKIANATKISGRTSKGLGVAMLNAITNNRYYSIQNNITKETRKEILETLTNYNILVLDQTMKNNSSVSLVNTSVLRSGGDYDANVTAGLFSLNDKKNMWNVSGKLAFSQLVGYKEKGKTYSGYSHSFSFGKTSGRFNFNVAQELVNKTFNNNDLGYLSRWNYIDHYMRVGYNWIKPTNWYNRIYVNINGQYSRRFTNPSDFQAANINVNTNAQLKNLWQVGTSVGYEPKGHDYFEPRKEGRVFNGWSNYFLSAWFQTNDSKKYTVSARMFYVDRSLFNSKRYMIAFENRYRFNNNLTVSHEINVSPQKNNVGFAAFSGSDIIFGRRDIATVDNLLNIKYSFNNMMNINTRIRHYWSKVNYDKYFTLLQNGDLGENNTFTANTNQNYNVFNIDMVYTWQFAPGSFINVIWKNAAEQFNRQATEGYFKNFENTMRQDEVNNLTVKVIYFIDYLQLRKQLKKKKQA